MEDEVTRPPPAGDEGSEETQGSNNGTVKVNRENATEGDAASVTGVQGFARETLVLGGVSEYMVEEGPLDDSTREEGGISVPPTATSFYSLQVFGPTPNVLVFLLRWFMQIEETMESLNLSSNPALAERHRLMLEIEGGNDEAEGVGRRTEEGSYEWRMRSDEGMEGRRSRGIIFSPGGNEAFMVTGREEEMREPPLVSTPREVGTRPKTVGQSYEQSSSKTISGGSAISKVAAREEIVMEEAVAPSPRSQGCLTDRALSPSQASVTSLLSGTSTVSNAARRRGLEWDYSEDLGMQEAIGQGQAAASLSTLEKMAIGSYTEFLR